MLQKFIKPVYAHCDIPCGIYETDSITNGATTCLRMIEKIEELGELDSTEKHNNFIRAVMIKEDHAQKCKDGLYVLWSDYFKPEHLERFPQLHETIWKATKQASKVKQTVSRAEAEALVAAVAEVAELFAQSKQK
ncbi:superoxide dismutase, Ni [Candidatus Saccharibacteria bacterium]|nr:MAG: superoxide dismutase, Ni [Candidatus Saccharibacteria bacterium]